MKDLKRSARFLNTMMNVCFWILLAYGLFTVGFHAVALYQLLTDPAALSGKMGLTIGWLTLKADQGFGIGLDAAVMMKLLQLLSAAVFTAIGCSGILVLRRILLPIEVGQPFRSGICSDLMRLSKHAFWLGIADNLFSQALVLLIENHYDLPSLLVHGSITRVSVDFDYRPAWIILSAVLSILATVFRHGEQLQTLSDETL